MRIITFNVGSSTIKYGIFNAETLKVEEEGESNNREFHLEDYLRKFDQDSILGVGHRIVHGGGVFFEPTLINNNILKRLEAFIPLAPLHQPEALKFIKHFFSLWPSIPQVACFDTMFHHNIPDIFRQYGVGRSLRNKNVKMFGFHGLSYEYIVYQLSQIITDVNNKRIIVAHLGSGSSVCAIKNCKSYGTSMGFTPLDGLMMGTRCGYLDPGVVLYLIESLKMTVHEVSDLLYKYSGLKGVSGISQDVRVLLESPDQFAQEAIGLYAYRVAFYIGALMMNIGGIDSLVFTGGIGANSGEIRKRICYYIKWLGLLLDNDKNFSNEHCISEHDSNISVYVIPTNEEYIIARHVKNILTSC